MQETNIERRIIHKIKIILLFTVFTKLIKKFLTSKSQLLFFE